MLTKQIANDFDEIQGMCRKRGYRAPREIAVHEAIKAFSAEFSIPSALSVVRR